MTILSCRFHIAFIQAWFHGALEPKPILRRTTMKMRQLVTVTLIAIVFAACESEKSGRHEQHESQAQLQAEAKISKADAERIALSQAPNGSIKEGELEREKGKLIWSFDIAIPGAKEITEVNVDAVTGQVISTEKESPKAEAKEKEKEKDDDKN